MRVGQFSITDRQTRKLIYVKYRDFPRPRPLIRPVEQIDLEALHRLVLQLKQEIRIDKICNRIPKTWSDKNET